MHDPNPWMPVTFELPRPGKLVEVWFGGHDQRPSHAVLRDQMWLVDSRDLPSDVGVGEKLITHWRDASTAPGEIDPTGFLETAADVVLEGIVPKLEQPQRQLPK